MRGFIVHTLEQYCSQMKSGRVRSRGYIVHKGGGGGMKGTGFWLEALRRGVHVWSVGMDGRTVLVLILNK